MTAPAVVIELSPAPTAELVTELQAEIARLRATLGRVWEQRHDVTGAANTLLECHGSVATAEELADEIAMRVEGRK